MSQVFLGQIVMTGFNFAPKGYALCNGQSLPISQNAALFSLLGTTYGGDGISTFQLPNLQGRTPIHSGTSVTGDQYVLGQSAGEATHTLTASEVPAHTHGFNGTSAAAATNNPSAATPAVPSAAVGNVYAPPPASVAMVASQSNLGGQPHDNMQPYLVINFVIALQGIYPTRN